MVTSNARDSSSANHNSAHRLRRIELAVRPETNFPVPYSDGYTVYSALLSVLHEVEPDVSSHVHDTPLGSLHSSGLVGGFGDSNRAHHKTVRETESYRLSLGIVDPRDAEIFQSLVNALVLEGETIELTNGTLRVESFESENTSHGELLDRAAATGGSGPDLHFRTPTCIEEAGDVTTMFPYRAAVFRSLLGKWNMTCPDELELDLDRETILRQVIEKPDLDTLQTHSVLVSRGTTENGENRNIFRQGFTGRCGYGFKDASDAMENAVNALALFGEYSGVGSAVARGCGSVEVEGS